MKGSDIGVRLIGIRRLRMWTQGRLAKEAGVSPTTVSGIETGRIARPHFGTLQKLAQALDLDPKVLLTSSEEPSEPEVQPPLSLQWARSAEQEEFEQVIEGATLDELKSLVQELEEERARLQKLYGEFPEGSEQIYQGSDPRCVRSVSLHYDFYDVSPRQGRERAYRRASTQRNAEDY